MMVTGMLVDSTMTTGMPADRKQTVSETAA